MTDVRSPAPTAETGAVPSPAPAPVGIVVPHTHWDREWYAPLETMRFHLVRFFDELVETLEAEPDLPAFLLDGQSIMLEDYLEIRTGMRDRVHALIRRGRLRAGPFYVQPDELHVSGEAIVRNLLQGIAVARDAGWVMREGYLPDTFGHVPQLPQVLRGFGIETFYAMRGFGADADETGSALWWEAPDGSRVRVEWLTESYSNAAVLRPEPEATWLHHGAIVRYDSLDELLQRLSRRARGGALLLLNGGDHLRVQDGLPETVGSLGSRTAHELRLGGLEEFSALARGGPEPTTVLRGELRSGARHDVFDGIGSTRTPMKREHEQVDAHLTGVAERLDALAMLVDGRTSVEFLRHAWRLLLQNHAHDSICGCSLDEVHDEMATRCAKVAQISRSVAQDALDRIAHAVAPEVPERCVPVVVVNPSTHRRSGLVDVHVLPDLEAPVGQRWFGWQQGEGVTWSEYALRDAAGRRVPFTVSPRAESFVADPLDRRKEVVRDRISFSVEDLPPLGVATYVLASDAAATSAPVTSAPVTSAPAASVSRSGTTLDNGVLRAEVDADGTVTLTHLGSGRTTGGLLELLDDGDAGDEYGAGLLGDEPVTSRGSSWQVGPGELPHALRATTTMSVPRALADDRRGRDSEHVDVPITLELVLAPGADRLDVTVTVDNRADDHRLRLRLPTGVPGGTTLAETAFGTLERPFALPSGDGWRERPSGARAMRRFVVAQDDSGGLQVLTEGLYEYTPQADGAVDVTLLRGVGWMARTDHPQRPHKVGPEVPTPGAQCRGVQAFRVALRPLPGRTSEGSLHRAAEELTVPLQAAAVQGVRRPSASPPGITAARLGIDVAPEDVVLSAVKAAEDGDGVVVRVFNASSEARTARLRLADPTLVVEQCDLEEVGTGESLHAADGVHELALRGGQLCSLRLRSTGGAR